MKKIRIVLADDHAIVREGLRGVFSNQSDFEVLAEAADGDQALALSRKLRPDVLLLDLTMPGCSGQPLLQILQRQVSETAVLIISMHREEQYAPLMIRAGARGFITKTRSPKELVDAARKVAAGELFISPELAHTLAVGSISGAGKNAEYDRLSTREQEVLRALAHGHTVTAIADRLYLSPKTVSTHKSRLLRKLGLSNISELVRYALDNNLI